MTYRIDIDICIDIHGKRIPMKMCVPLAITVIIKLVWDWFVYKGLCLDAEKINRDAWKWAYHMACGRSLGCPRALNLQGFGKGFELTGFPTLFSSMTPTWETGFQSVLFIEESRYVLTSQIDESVYRDLGFRANMHSKHIRFGVISTSTCRQQKTIDGIDPDLNPIEHICNIWPPSSARVGSSGLESHKNAFSKSHWRCLSVIHSNGQHTQY